MLRKITGSIGVLALSAGIMFGVSAPASADTNSKQKIEVAQPSGLCNTSTIHRTAKKQSTSIQYLGQRYHIDNRKGKNTVTSTMSNSKSGSTAATLSGTIEGGMSSAIYTAKASVSKSIAKTGSWSTSFSTTLTAPAKTIKYTQITTNRYKVNVQSYRHNSNCVKVGVKSATLSAPSSLGWKTW